MTSLTLESLDTRLERLERWMDHRPGQDSKPIRVLPGAGDWAAAIAAIEGLADYDYEAVKRQDDCDWEEARKVQSNAEERS